MPPCTIGCNLCRTPQQSAALRYLEYLKPRLGDPGLQMNFIFQSKDKRAEHGLLDAESIRDMFAVMALAHDVQVNIPHTADARLRDICWRDLAGMSLDADRLSMHLSLRNLFCDCCLGIVRPVLYVQCTTLQRRVCI